MLNEYILYLGSIIILAWGIAHIFPTKKIVHGIGRVSNDYKLMFAMERIAAGLTLIFIGLIIFFVTLLGYSDNVVSILIIRLFSLMLFILAILSIFTGARTSILPNKICPLIMTFVGILFIIGSII